MERVFERQKGDKCPCMSWWKKGNNMIDGRGRALLPQKMTMPPSSRLLDIFLNQFARCHQNLHSFSQCQIICWDSLSAIKSKLYPHRPLLDWSGGQKGTCANNHFISIVVPLHPTYFSTSHEEGNWQIFKKFTKVQGFKSPAKPFSGKAAVTAFSGLQPALAG